MRKYIKDRKLRPIPVGYSAADVSKNRMQTAQYFNCGPDEIRSDFFAFNDYSWCNSDFKTSGWDQKVKNFTDYGLPIFLSEWGCIESRPRKFEELDALMGDQMTSVYSGGLMYEYSIEDNDFGIVKIKGNNLDKIDEFAAFKDALAQYPSPTGNGGASSESHSVDCPPEDPDWQVDPSSIPAMPKEAEKYMNDGAGDGPGLDGDGSQQAGKSGLSAANVTYGDSDSPTSTGGSDDEGAGVSMHSFTAAPLMVTGATVFFALFGTLLL